MAYKTLGTCEQCGHEGETLNRRVVICDQCGVQGDLVWNPYSRDQTPPIGGPWTSGFWADDEGKGQGRAEFCSQACRSEFFKAHTSIRVRA